ncbi:MAG: MATE family efflux transporter, partial [Frisingicoccus sp.]
ENFSYNLSQICILSVINPYGAAVTATKGYCSLLANFAYVYAIAISEAVQIVIGYLLGRGQVDEVGEKGLVDFKNFHRRLCRHDVCHLAFQPFDSWNIYSG